MYWILISKLSDCSNLTLLRIPYRMKIMYKVLGHNDLFFLVSYSNQLNRMEACCELKSRIQRVHSRPTVNFFPRQTMTEARDKKGL